jgi:hypothetical protein
LGRLRISDPLDDAPWLRRLTARYDPSCWTGVAVRAIRAATSEQDGVRLHTPDHFLGAAWPPAAAGPSRWPEVVVIGSPRSANALAELFLKLPPDARLYLADREQVDVVLAATILERSDRNLEPYQRAALAAFIADEARRERSLIDARYTDRDVDYEAFRARVAPRADEG